MKRASVICAILLLTLCVGSFAADTAKDVPQNHWARKDVDAVLSRGIMAAPAGRFNGAAKITRTELIIAMAAFGRSLERGLWKAESGRTLKETDNDKAAASTSSAVTRYELAAVISRMGTYAAGGLPKAGPKRFGESVALPKSDAVSKVKQSDPAYSSVQYLAKNRMIWPKSVLARPGSELVTGKDVGASAAAVITGVIDLLTDEPQNREEIGPPPSRGAPKRG
jgi:hypothetical protein